MRRPSTFRDIRTDSSINRALFVGENSGKHFEVEIVAFYLIGAFAEVKQDETNLCVA